MLNLRLVRNSIVSGYATLKRRLFTVYKRVSHWTSYHESLLVIMSERDELSREGEETTLADDQVEAIICQIDVHIFGRPNYIESSEPATKVVGH